MQTPFLSIVIPVYNAEQTINRAIQSITSQNIGNIEIIIVNDGSTDQSYEICKKLALYEKNIRLLNIENSGVSHARNLGIEQAKGKYVAFLDADDYYEEKALEKVISEIEADTQLMIFGYHVNYYNKTSRIILPSNDVLKFTDEQTFRNYAISLIRNEIINAPWNKIYLTSYLKKRKILFPNDINIGEDLKFNLSVIRDIHNVKIMNEALITYTVKKGEGLVSRFRIDRLEIRYKLLMEIRDLLIYWEIIEHNQAMIDRFLIRDIMAYFMDFYKGNCKLTYHEKQNLINQILSKKEIRSILTNIQIEDITTRCIQLILLTNNSRFILLSAKIFNLKRSIR